MFLDHDVIVMNRVGLVIRLNAIVLELVGLVTAPDISSHHTAELLACRRNHAFVKLHVTPVNSGVDGLVIQHLLCPWRLLRLTDLESDNVGEASLCVSLPRQDGPLLDCHLYLVVVT